MNTSNKIMLLGDSGVGKSTLVNTLSVNTLSGSSNSRPQSTVGCSIQILPHQYSAGTPQESVELIELWDVGGTNVHRQASTVFLDNVCGVIFVHDLSNSKSEQNLLQWSDLLYNHRQTHYNSNSSRVGFEFNSPFLDVERSGTLPTLVVGSRLDMAPHRAREQSRPAVVTLRPHETVFLDCRKEISPGSTNKLIFSRFFDSVIDNARSIDNHSSFSQARRRKLA
ncbi:ras of complex, roc, domain of DAPkinase domain-containing protein [Ditylenchus destructor]|nr:ras of complex, roc, domain of DAPkinase domain-containing protein [Ditylenchus destructor]